MKNTRITCVLFLLVSLAAAHNAQAAPIQWSGPGSNGHWYEVFLTPVNFGVAQAAANAAGGYLVTLTSAAENTFVTGILGPGNVVWGGGFQSAANPGYSEPGGGWAWYTGEAFTFVNWNGGEPGDHYNGLTDISGNEDHFIIHNGTGGRWHDVNGNHPDYKFGYIVEWTTDPMSVPEPSSLLLLTAAVAGLAVRFRFRSNLPPSA